MLQSILSTFMTAAVVAFLAYMTLLISRSMVKISSRFTELVWLLEKTPALFSAAIVAIIAAISVSNGFIQVSNHIIITLDILFLFSSIMLILFHQLKESILPSK